MAEPVRARRLTDDEGRRLQQTVRRGKHGTIRVRRALVIMASIRAARPDGAPIYVILDNLSANKTPTTRAWAAR